MLYIEIMYNDKNLDYLSKKYYSAVATLATFTGSPAKALCFLLDKNSFLENIRLPQEDIPESCTEHFKFINQILSEMEAKANDDREKFKNKFPMLKNESYRHVTIYTEILKLRNRAAQIVENICFIAFELDRLNNIRNNKKIP